MSKNYQSICKFVLITCQIGFDIALTNVEAKLKQRSDNVISMLKQRCAILKNHCINVAQRCANAV